MKKRVSWFDLILGEERKFTLEERILNAILFSSILAGLLSFISDLLLNLGPAIYIMTLIGTVVLMLLYFFARMKYSPGIVFAIYSVLLISVFIYLWYTNGGMLGAALVFFMPMTFLIPLFLRGRARILIFVFLLLMGAGLLLFEIHHPGFVKVPGSYQTRTIDAFMAAIFVSVSVLLIAILVLHSYQKEHQKVTNLNASKDKILSIIAHDLINPVGSLKGLAKLLSDKHEKMSFERRNRIISALHKSSEETYNLLENLLLWGQSESGLNKANKEYVSVQYLVSDAISVLKEGIESKSLQPEMDMENNLMVYVDKNMITTSIRNILSNAIKFTPKGKKITVKAFRNKKNDKINILIRDEGVGMNSSTLAQVFNKHSFITTKGTNNESGTGFGLKLTKEFVELNGGEISVKSEPNRGTEFLLSFDVE
ncbi:MAG: HAMP domain-containing sensor histidine kinase [Bacteroidales bacterium]